MSSVFGTNDEIEQNTLIQETQEKATELSTNINNLEKIISDKGEPIILVKDNSFTIKDIKITIDNDGLYLYFKENLVFKLIK